MLTQEKSREQLWKHLMSRSAKIYVLFILFFSQEVSEQIDYCCIKGDKAGLSVTSRNIKCIYLLLRLTFISVAYLLFRLSTNVTAAAVLKVDRMTALRFCLLFIIQKLDTRPIVYRFVYQWILNISMEYQWILNISMEYQWILSNINGISKDIYNCVSMIL